MDKTTVTKDFENKKLVIDRALDAPAAKVWRAYAEKDLFVKWWGPEGWETTVTEFEFQPGGRNHYCMKCVDEGQGEFFGQESWGLMEYTAIEDGVRIEYIDSFSDADGNKQDGMPNLRCVVEFVESDGTTHLVSTIYGDTAEEIEKLIEMGMIEGFDSSANKLEALAQTL